MGGSLGIVENCNLRKTGKATDMVALEAHRGGGQSAVYSVLWACILTMAMLFSFSACAWHRRRMQRRREGLDDL